MDAVLDMLRVRLPLVGARLTLLVVVLLGAAGCGDATLDVVNPDLGLLAHWAFDEDQAGSVAEDSSGFGLAGMPSPNPPVPTRQTPPVHFEDSHSLSFNGQDQWIQLGNPGLLNAGGPVSLAAWIRATSVDGDHDVVAHGYRFNPNQEVALRISSGVYEFTYWDTVNHAATAQIPASDLGSWVHLCGVFDGSAYSLYRNGALVGLTSDGTAPPPNIDAIWGIGARAPQPSGPDRVMQGQIDDVRIYGRALGAEEVAALFRR